MAVARSARLDRTARAMRVEACEQGERLQGCAPSSADDEHQQGRARAQRRSGAGSPVCTERHQKDQRKDVPKKHVHSRFTGAAQYSTVKRHLTNLNHGQDTRGKKTPGGAGTHTGHARDTVLYVARSQLTHTHSLSRDTHETDTRTSQSNLKTNPTHRPTHTSKWDTTHPIKRGGGDGDWP